ncbi:nuclear transport factor 2 family protein [Pantoea sp. 18069]|uniref:nuclear transport factor 2 family protein n=1 Tax=Pantoea sp. 18069 TaxID=2681415 RepID=UPI001359450F|nr:nuclear transport factor 2 family protein [Pantoea sp. 18069]
MNTPDETGLRAAEESRRQAMLAADTQRLSELLSQQLVYVHSNGGRDNRDSYLDKLASGRLRYATLEFAAPQIRLIGRAGMVHSLMRATVLRDGGQHAVASSTLAVWEHGATGWTLLAVQASPEAAP